MPLLPDYPLLGRFSTALLLPLLLFPSLSRVQGDCTHLHIPNASLRSGDPKDSYPVGTVLQYRCIPGFEPIPGERLSVTCLDTSKWSPEKPKFCRGRLCPTISLENGRIIKSTDLRLGDKITLGCNEGYRIVGQNTLRCQLIGGKVDWDRELPLCQRIPCFPPPNIADGTHTGEGLHDFDHGTAITYTCNRPYTLIGSRTITCLTAADGKNGEWRPAAPTCKIVSCPRPKIENGGLTTTFKPAYDYGNLVQFVCNPGFTLVGSYYSKCEADSTWQPPFPTCYEGIFTTTTVSTPGNGTTDTGGGGGVTGGGGGGTLHPEIASTAVSHTGFSEGSTHSPETKPPGDDTEPNHSPGAIIGSVVVAVLLGLCLIAAGWKYRSCFKKGKTDPSSNSECYRAVATHTEIGLEPQAS